MRADKGLQIENLLVGRKIYKICKKSKSSKCLGMEELDLWRMYEASLHGYTHQFWHRALYKEIIEVKRRKGRGRIKHKVPHVVASSNFVTTDY